MRKEQWDRKACFEFTIQWHITYTCDKRCLHCYMSDQAGRLVDHNPEMDLKDELRVIDDLAKMVKAWGVKARINFTGGDPLLNSRLFTLMAHAQHNGVRIGILGNTNHLDDTTLDRLQKVRLVHFQTSLDGLEKNHDRMRGTGDFNQTLTGLRRLKQWQVPTAVMFTLTRTNAADLIPLIHLVVDEGINLFDFARVVPTSGKPALACELLSPEEFRHIIEAADQEYTGFTNQGIKTKFGRKDPLWALYFWEQGRLILDSTATDLIHTGCSIGNNSVTLLPDGTLLACRRLPIQIGNIKQGGLRNIFIESEPLNKLRNHELTQCDNCRLLPFCRGCRAIAYGINSLYGQADPQCWSQVIDERRKT